MSHKSNYSFLTDFYHLTMAQGFYDSGRFEDQVAFEVFFREPPFKESYSILAGVQPIIEEILNSSFSDSVIKKLRATGSFGEPFLEYLSTFQFKGTIWSLKEGEMIFPQEPIMRVEGNLIEANCVESLILNLFNFQSMIATKASRIYRLLEDKPFFELGLRRAFGLNGALSSTRASFIGGAKATSNVYGALELGIPLVGSMSHSWVMSYDSEIESFLAFGREYPHSIFFLIDTYDTLSQGLPHAITAFKILEKEGVLKSGSLKGIRIDSGDLEYLSKRIRTELDKNGLQDVKILVSNELDENIIMELIKEKAPVDFYGIGTNLVTASGAKPLGGVYKMVAMQGKDGSWEPKIKVSNNSLKTTIPARKNIIRFYNQKRQALADLVLLESEMPFYLEQINKKAPIVLEDRIDPLKETKLIEYQDFKILLNPIMKKGEMIGQSATINEMQDYTKEQFNIFHSSHTRTVNPHFYKVGFSKGLIKLTKDMILASRKI